MFKLKREGPGEAKDPGGIIFNGILHRVEDPVREGGHIGVLWLFEPSGADIVPANMSSGCRPRSIDTGGERIFRERRRNANPTNFCHGRKIKASQLSL